MEKMILNKTPVRTSVCFGINDISLDLDVPLIKEFENVTIVVDEPIDINVKKEEKNMSSKIGLNLRTNYQIEINIEEYKNVKKPILINVDFDDDNLALVDNIKINMAKNSSASFIIKYSSNEKAFHYLKQETFLEPNSDASISIVNLVDNNSNSFIAVENTVDENATLKHVIVDFGGEKKVSNYYTKLIGYNSKNILNNIYLGTNKDVLDINYNIDVFGKNAKASIESQGALFCEAVKNFKGTINFMEGCKKASGSENENCVLLSDKAKSKSLPMLLCHEEDVEGNHSVSSGKIDEKKLFYIMTKGISKKDAEKLIIIANFNKIIDSIPDEELRNEIMKKI